MSSSDPLVHALFSCNSSWSVAPPPSRRAGRSTTTTSGSGPQQQQQQRLQPVPNTTEGLRILAAEGSWAELLELATSLEREMLAHAPRVAVGASSSSSTASTPISASPRATAGQGGQQQQQTVPQYDGATLQLLLARTTAYIKMGDFNRAVQLLENVPWGFVPEAEVPFSLVFLRSFVPMMLPQAGAVDFARVQAKLYALLTQVEQQLARALAMEEEGSGGDENATSTTDTATPRRKQKNVEESIPASLLEHRRFRVGRAIVACHVRMGENPSAIEMLTRLADFHLQRRDRFDPAVVAAKKRMAEKEKRKQQQQQQQQEQSDSVLEAQSSLLYENVFLTSPAVTKDRSGFSGASTTNFNGTFNSSLPEDSASSPSASMVFTSFSPGPTAFDDDGDNGNDGGSSSDPEKSTNTKNDKKKASSLRDGIQKMMDIATMEHMLCLQQALCLALYSGNAPLSHRLRKSIEGSLHSRSSTASAAFGDDDSDDDDAEEVPHGPEPKHLRDLIMCLNDSLLDVFFDRPSDAAARLSAVVGGFLIDDSSVLPQLAPPLSRPGPHVVAAQKRALPVGVDDKKQEQGASSSDEKEASTSNNNKLHLTLPFYLSPSRSLHVQYAFLSICLTVVALVPHVLHAPPATASQRAPASVESRRPQTAVDTAALCSAALDRIFTCYPAIALRMPGALALLSEVRTAMSSDLSSARKITFQTVLSHLVAGRESVAQMMN